MPPRRAVELRVGGQTYRVVATDDDRHVQHLAELVDRKYLDVVPQGRGVTAQQAMFLTALALAEELEEQRARAARLEAERDRATRLTARAKEVVSRLLARVDSALSPALPSVGVEGAKSNSPVAAARAEPDVWSEGRAGLTPEPAAADPLMDPPDAIHEPVMIELLSPKPRESGGEAAVPRGPRGGLRLVRQSSSPDDDSR